MAKDSKAAGATEVRPKMSGTVHTPIVPRKPNGPEWEALEAATSLEQIAEVESKARTLGYGDTGRLMTRIRERAAELGGLTNG